MALFPPETIILHRVRTEYFLFSMVLQNIFQANSGAPQPTPNGTKTVQEKNTTQQEKYNNNQNYHRAKKEYFPGSHNQMLSL